MTPEEQLLLRCVHSIITDEPLGDPSSSDWDQVYHFAEVNRLIPILHAVIPRESIPEMWTERFEQAARRQRMRAAVMIDESHRILAEFAQVGIQVIPFKGIAISQQAYPSPSMRYFDDLDLLVEEQNGQDALGVLRVLGYEEHPNAPHPDWHHLAPYVHMKRGTMVEIHVDLVRRAKDGWPIDEIWQRARVESLGEISTLVLSAEDSLIASVLHARHNLYDRLSYFIDSAFLARSTSGDRNSTQLASELSREAGAESAIGYVLDTSSRLFDLERFSGFNDGRKKYWLANQIASWKSLDPKNSTLKQGPLSNMLEMFLMDSLGDSLSLAARLVAPPRSFIAVDSKERAPMRRYARRLGRRMRLALRQVVQLIQRR